MSAEIGDLQRRLANIFRVGRVSAVDLATGRVKMQFQGVDSPWVPWMTGRAGSVNEWCPPSIGEQVCMCSPSGEFGAGFVMAGGINYDGHPATDSREGVRKITLPAGGAYEIAIGGMTLTLANGKLTLNGDIEVTGDVKAGTVSLKTHTHIHTASEPAPTGAPIP